MGSGICGTHWVRAANAMLTALGGDQVSLLLPGTATSERRGRPVGIGRSGRAGCNHHASRSKQQANEQLRTEPEDRVYSAGFSD